MLSRLTRLTDRIEADESGGQIIVKRYGLWGTTAEIEVNGDKIIVVKGKRTLINCRNLSDAKLYLEELVRRRK